MKTENSERYYRNLEKEMMKLADSKTLISNNYYTEEKFGKRGISETMTR